MTPREPTTAEVLATLHTHDGDTIAARLRAELPDLPAESVTFLACLLEVDDAEHRAREKAENE